MESCSCIGICPASKSVVKLEQFLDGLVAMVYFAIALELIYYARASCRWQFMHFGTVAIVCGAAYVTNWWKCSSYSIKAASVITVVKVSAAVILWLTVFILKNTLPDLLNLRKRELVLKNRVSGLSREMGLLLHQKETERGITKLMRELRSTLDGEIIIKSAVVGLSQIFDLEECALWFPSQTNRSLQLSHAFNSSVPLGSIVSLSHPVVAELLNRSGPVRIRRTCPLVRTTHENGRCQTPEVVAFRVPLRHFSNTEPNGWIATSAISYAAIVLVLPSDSIRMFRDYELELVEAVTEEMSVALAHASAVKESNMACAHLMKQNVSLESTVQNIEMALHASNVSIPGLLRQMLIPLHAMITLPSLLLETELTPEQRETTEKVLRESSFLETLIKNAIELSRLENGSLKLHNIVFNLSAAFKQVTDMMMPVAAVKKIDLLLSLAPDLPVYAVGDREQLINVILNVVGNAVKFTNEGYVLVTASIAEPQPFRDWCPSNFYMVSSENHFYLKVQVEDTGCGIDPQETATLFKRFTCSENGSNNHGLGLALCKRIINAMGGDIWVESEGLGKGCTATFIVKLGISNASTSY